MAFSAPEVQSGGVSSFGYSGTIAHAVLAFGQDEVRKALAFGRAADSSEVLATLSDPPHPQPALLGAKKELIKYERDDGVALTGTLHTPAGWTEADGPLPTILWAYPREFKSKASASGKAGASLTESGLRKLGGSSDEDDGEMIHIKSDSDDSLISMHE